MAGEFKTLAGTLVDIEALPWNYALYLPSNQDWTLETLCAVLDPDDYGDDEEGPEFAVQNHLQYALGVQQVQDVVRFALAKNPQAPVADLFSAFLYYYDHDAFERP
ncbi:MAG TPA: hypothetical protein VKK31_03335 [Thermoanaerobaculia bacterium]|nr:hypothetical protein [Thermoanaerobaculia bacterium]